MIYIEPILNEEGLGHCDECGKYFDKLHCWGSVIFDGQEEKVDESFVCWDCFRKEMMKFAGDTDVDRMRMFNNNLWTKDEMQVGIKCGCVCGYTWTYKGNLTYACCPNCKTQNKIKDAIERFKKINNEVK